MPAACASSWPRPDGYLAPAFEGPDHKPLWDLRAVLSFIDGLLIGAQPMSIVQHGWEDVARAAQRLKIGPGQILRMIEARRLPRVGRHVDRQGYAAILVQMDEVERLLDRPEARGVSVELFAKTVGIRPAAAMRLVRDHKCSKLLTRTLSYPHEVRLGHPFTFRCSQLPRGEHDTLQDRCTRSNEVQLL